MRPRVRLHVVSMDGLSDGPGPTKALITAVERQMRKGGSVTSASGRTAALAVNYCERHGLDYQLVCDGGMYFVAIVKSRR